MTANYYRDNQDLQFHLEKRLDFDLLFQWLSPEVKTLFDAKTADDFKQSWVDIMDTLGQISAQQIAPHAATIDKEPLVLKDNQVHFSSTMQANIKALLDFGLSTLSLSPQDGGQGAPFFIEMMSCELLNRACPSTMMNCSWFAPIARMLKQFADPKLIAEYLPKIATGEFSGNMALTEADAGSDLGAIKTYAIKQEDGSWQLFGEKKFITNGQREISLVLAKTTKGATGLQSLSLFLCPKTHQNKANYHITKLEKKMALNGSPTCELLYQGSTAWLLGEPNKGYQYMLEIMNESRIGVGFQGIGLMEAIWQEATQYAQTRKTWNKPLAQHDLIAEKLLNLEIELKAVRSLGYHLAFQRSLLVTAEQALNEQDLDPDQRQKLETRVTNTSTTLRRLTPLLKYYVAERAVDSARLALQIFGGYGFSKEYAAEWRLRESLIYPIYEGTSQMQALMATKDTIKSLIKDPKGFFDRFLSTSYKSLVGKRDSYKKFYKIQQMIEQTILSIAIKLLQKNINITLPSLSNVSWREVKKLFTVNIKQFHDFSPALKHAERLCEMKAMAVCAESLIEDARCDKSRWWIAEHYLNLIYFKMAYLKNKIQDTSSLASVPLAEKTETKPTLVTAPEIQGT